MRYSRLRFPSLSSPPARQHAATRSIAGTYLYSFAGTCWNPVRPHPDISHSQAASGDVVRSTMAAWEIWDGVSGSGDVAAVGESLRLHLDLDGNGP